MGFLSDIWDAAKSIGKGVADIFVGVAAVLVLTIWAIGYVIFSVVGHLYKWIDETIEKVKGTVSSVIMIDPKETEIFVKGLPEKKRTILEGYSPGATNSLMVATDRNGKVQRAQITSTTKGFDDIIEDAFRRGEIVEQPVC